MFAGGAVKGVLITAHHPFFMIVIANEDFSASGARSGDNSVSLRRIARLDHPNLLSRDAIDGVQMAVARGHIDVMLIERQTAITVESKKPDQIRLRKIERWHKAPQ